MSLIEDDFLSVGSILSAVLNSALVYFLNFLVGVSIWLLELKLEGVKLDWMNCIFF